MFCSTDVVPCSTQTMKKPKYTVLFNRKKTLRKNGTGLIQIQVYLRRKSKYFSTGQYILPGEWDEVKGVINRKDAEYINQKIQMQIHDLEEYEYKARAKGEHFRLDMIPDSREPRKQNFLTYMENLIEKEDIAPGTRKQHRSSLKHLKNFGKIVYFQDVTRKNIEAFDKYLHELRHPDTNERLVEQSSIYGQHKRIKKWIRRAIIEGLVKEDPYLIIKIPSGNRNTIKYLTENELAAIEQKEITNKRLSAIRDVFLFSCYTGLAYQEAANLCEKNIAVDEDGTSWLTGERGKVSGNRQTSATGFFMVPLHQKALEILKRYKGTKPGFLLPVISNVQYNSFLKEIAILCDVETNLTTHVARHTFATTFTMAKGISIETVKEMLGHSSVRMTERYAKVLKIRVKDEMKRIL